MVPSYIARDTLIAAPIETVWALVTDPARIPEWFADEAEFELRPGATGVLNFRANVPHPLTVEAVEPPHTFAYRWTAPPAGMSGDGYSTRVAFTLREESGGTRLTVTESGLRDLRWPEDSVADYARRHTEGWTYFLGRLEELAASAPAAR